MLLRKYALFTEISIQNCSVFRNAEEKDKKKDRKKEMNKERVNELTNE